MSVSFGREVANVTLRVVAVVTTILLIVVGVGWLYESELTISDGSCNIAFLPIEGVILPFSGLADAPLVVTPEDVDAFIAAAEEEAGIDGIIIEINSPGGTPVASERIAERLFNSSLPVVAVVGDVAASGGYLVASAADHIVASPMSDVGSIGVNMSYVENSKQNEEEGLTYVQLTSAEFKDAGSPERAITEEERALFQADLDIVHDAFVSLVAKYRNLDVATVDALANGASMPGSRALESKLIDSLGGFAEARGVISALINKPLDETIICDYTSPSLLDF